MVFAMLNTSKTPNTQESISMTIYPTVLINFTKIDLELINSKRIFASLPSTLVVKIQSQFPWAHNLSEVKYCLKHNIVTTPICSECGTIHSVFLKSAWSYEKYCSKKCTYAGRTKTTKETMMTRYGVEHNFELESQRILRRNTWVKNYGTDNPSKSELILNKIKDTKELKYGDQNYNNHEKYKNTCNERYGVDLFVYSDEFKTKVKQTKETRYGDPNFNNRLQSEETCMAKYGVRHVSQVTEIHSAQQKHRWYNITTPTGELIKVQGYERFVIPILWESHDADDIELIRNRLPQIFYNDSNNKKHRYFPDGFISKSNSIIEIKSEWTLRQTKDKMKTIITELELRNFNLRLLVYCPKSRCIDEYDLSSAKVLLAQL